MPLQEYNGGFDPFGTEYHRQHPHRWPERWPGGQLARLTTRSTTVRRAWVVCRFTPTSLRPTNGNLRASAGANAFAQVAERPGGRRPMGVNYAAGPIRVAWLMTATSADGKTVGVYGAYNFGFADLMFQWEKGDCGNAATRWLATTWNYCGTRCLDGPGPSGRSALGALSVRRPWSKVGYTNSSDLSRRSSVWCLDYSLSKRTIVYTDVAKQSGDGFLPAVVAGWRLDQRQGCSSTSASGTSSDRCDGTSAST